MTHDVLSNSSTDLEFFKVNGIASLLLVPIRNPKAPSIVIGFLSFTSNVPREWTPGDMVLLEMARDLVSATLCHPDIFINLDHEIAHLSATEVEARLSDEQHATVDRIVVLFEKMRRQSKIKDLWVSLGMSAFKYKLARFIISNQTIAMALPAFPFKSRNTNSNVIGTLPDMGEALALANLNSFALQVSEVYPPGCKILVVSDGRVFNDLYPVSDVAVSVYTRYIHSLGQGQLQFIGLDQMFSSSTENQFKRDAIVQLSGDKKPFGTWTPVDFLAPIPPAYPNWSIETTNPLPYRPFKYGSDYFVTTGIRRLDWDDWIELDNQWIRYQNIKLARLFGERASRLCMTVPEACDAALETMESVSEYLVCRYPSLFQFKYSATQKQIQIKATGEVYRIHSDDPLKYAALLIQDDLALVIEGVDGQHYLIAGAIPLPGFWRLEDKFNMSLTEIHTTGNVPQFREKLQEGMERFFQKMTSVKAFVRYNYSIQTDGELTWSSSIGSEETFGRGRKDARSNPCIENIHFRSERQALRRLPRSGAILFTVRTYFLPIIDISQELSVP
ncbi:unnamed protein product [Rotaria magnacalcarata]|uniref:Uncharacterized protein n=1 Tax=Rotaria magnacalcarata TaxID=392030 RepID=A0A816LUN6_9BILA|nr:unnamed protein product [Rotaria magnacalcarata]